MAYVHAHIESHHRTSFQASSLAVHGDAGALHLVFISRYYALLDREQSAEAKIAPVLPDDEPFLEIRSWSINPLRTIKVRGNLVDRER